MFNYSYVPDPAYGFLSGYAESVAVAYQGYRVRPVNTILSYNGTVHQCRFPYVTVNDMYKNAAWDNSLYTDAEIMAPSNSVVHSITPGEVFTGYYLGNPSTSPPANNSNQLTRSDYQFCPVGFQADEDMTVASIFIRDSVTANSYQKFYVEVVTYYRYIPYPEFQSFMHPTMVTMDQDMFFQCLEKVFSKHGDLSLARSVEPPGDVPYSEDFRLLQMPSSKKKQKKRGGLPVRAIIRGIVSVSPAY